METAKGEETGELWMWGLGRRGTGIGSIELRYNALAHPKQFMLVQSLNQGFRVSLGSFWTSSLSRMEGGAYFYYSLLLTGSTYRTMDTIKGSSYTYYIAVTADKATEPNSFQLTPRKTPEVSVEDDIVQNVSLFICWIFHTNYMGAGQNTR